jgi:hypothetical protein
MRILTKLLMVIAVGYLLSGCVAISHTYGPYMGKVVDKETDKPIEGAVVFMRFSTKSGNIGGSTTHYADAVEVLTDDKGDFLIPPHTIRLFRINHHWDKQGNAIVFKPGYGAYPGHPQSSISHYKEHRFPDNEFVTIKLPKLKTREERERNLFNVGDFDSSNIPYNKNKNIIRLYNSERNYLGLKLLKTPSNGGS